MSSVLPRSTPPLYHAGRAGAPDHRSPAHGARRSISKGRDVATFYPARTSRRREGWNRGARPRGRRSICCDVATILEERPDVGIVGTAAGSHSVPERTALREADEKFIGSRTGRFIKAQGNLAEMTKVDWNEVLERGICGSGGLWPFPSLRYGPHSIGIIQHLGCGLLEYMRSS
jgi:hypothetical protein